MVWGDIECYFFLCIKEMAGVLWKSSVTLPTSLKFLLSAGVGRALCLAENTIPCFNFHNIMATLSPYIWCIKHIVLAPYHISKYLHLEAPVSEFRKD